jgi:hypothetical protein
MSDEQAALQSVLANPHDSNNGVDPVLDLTLLVTPEKLCSSEFMKLLEPLYQRGELNRLVVDEVGPVQTHLPASD